MPFDVIDWIIRRLDEQESRLAAIEARQSGIKTLGLRFLEVLVVFVILAVNLGIERAAEILGGFLAAFS